jgi:molybdopterin-guanine dinucleotide biosynthesis protein A
MRIAAAILAGGKATRLGGIAKGLLPDKGGRSIVARLIEQVTAAGFAEIVISANDGRRYEHLIRPIITDRHAEIGPLGGIEAVLMELAPRADCVLFLPCDLPNITAAEILSLLQSYAASPGRIVFAHTAEGEHPLCAVVPTTALPAVTAAIASGLLGVGRLWRSLDARPVEIEDDARLLNINTPQDLGTWRNSS